MAEPKKIALALPFIDTHATDFLAAFTLGVVKYLIKICGKEAVPTIIQRAKLNGSLFSLTLVQIERKTFSHSMFRAKSNSSRMRSRTCPTKPRMNTLAKSDKLSDLR